MSTKAWAVKGPDGIQLDYIALDRIDLLPCEDDGTLIPLEWPVVPVTITEGHDDENEKLRARVKALEEGISQAARDLDRASHDFQDKKIKGRSLFNRITHVHWRVQQLLEDTE